MAFSIPAGVELWVVGFGVLGVSVASISLKLRQEEVGFRVEGLKVRV